MSDSPADSSGPPSETSVPVTTENEEAVPAAIVVPGLGLGRRWLVSLLFLALGLGGATAGWKLKCEFDFRSSPRFPSTGPQDIAPDEAFTMFGLERLIEALGIEPKPSSFHLLVQAGGGPQMSTSPNRAQVMADMEREAKRKESKIRPRRNKVAVYFLLLGIPLGACLGLAEGLRRFSLMRIIIGLLVGAVIGGAAGFLAGGLQTRAHVALASATFDGNYKLMIVQLVSWSVLAVGVGVGAAVASTTVKALASYVTGGVAAALLVALIYVPSALLIFPYDVLENALPADKNGSLYWYLFGSGMISLMIGHSSATTADTPQDPDTGTDP